MENELERFEKLIVELQKFTAESEDVNAKPNEIVETALLANIARSLAIIADKMKEKDVKL